MQQVALSSSIKIHIFKNLQIHTEFKFEFKQENRKQNRNLKEKREGKLTWLTWTPQPNAAAHHRPILAQNQSIYRFAVFKIRAKERRRRRLSLRGRQRREAPWPRPRRG
jgi:hypothetical protein